MSKRAPYDWNEKVVAITGASRGIGAQIAYRVANKGAKVALLARSESDLVAVAKRVGEDRAFVGIADVTDPSSIEAALDGASHKLGPPDVLVNNAGTGLYRSLLETPLEDLERLWRGNVVGPYAATPHVLPSMIERRSGVIVNVSSIAGRIGSPLESAYCATKFALDGISESLRVELTGTGVRVCVVNPGPVDTDFFTTRGTPYRRKRPRPVTASVVADATVDAVERYRDDVFIPRWFRSVLVAKTLVPALYRIGSRTDFKRTMKEEKKHD